eukprot:RCo050365
MASESSVAASQSQSFTVGVVGGGIAGSLAALRLCEALPQASVVLIERRPALASGGPYCHLHSGGLLYATNIDNDEARVLLHHSLLFAQTFPQCLLLRPTIVAFRKDAPQEGSVLVQRCEAMREEYRRMVTSGHFEASLGPPDDYFQAYTRDDLDRLLTQPSSTESQGDSSVPATNDDWALRFARVADLDEIKYPLVCVRELGVSCARCSAVLELKLAELQGQGRLTLLTSTEVVCVKREADPQSGSTTWAVRVRTEGRGHEGGTAPEPTKLSVEYLVNAAGFETPTVDSWVQDAAAG